MSAHNMASMDEHDRADVLFSEKVWDNQQTLSSALRVQYDFIVCGSGSPGSVVALQSAPLFRPGLGVAVRFTTAPAA